MPESLGEGPSLKLERQIAETNLLKMINLEIEIQGEILQVRDNNSTKRWSQVYPSREFRTQDMSFAYDELRGMGNGKHAVKTPSPTGKVAGGLLGGEKPAE
jgi:hypothetical protein